jgi:hypothetical protein
MIHSDDLDFILSDQLKEMEVGVTSVVFRDPEIEFNKLNIQGLPELADQNNTVKSLSSGNNRKNI